MSDLLHRGAAWLTCQLQQFASRPIVYCRGLASIPVLATPARTRGETSDTQGLRIQTEIRDWLVPTASLKLAGDAILPERGDRIQERTATELVVYEVVPLGSEPPWRYCDPSRTMLRIHVREMDRESL
jgi:hypothetical protein